MSEAAGAPAAAPSVSTSQPNPSGGGDPASTNSTSPGPVTTPVASKPEGGASASPSPSSDTREYKINGKTVKMSQKEADDYVSMSYAAQQKFNEAAQIRKEHEAKKELYKTNRIQAFIDATEDMSPEDRRAVIEEFYAKQYIAKDEMTPQEIALADREEKIAKWEAEQKGLKARSDKEAEDKLVNTHRERIQQEIVETLEASGLPKSKFIAARLAFYMQQNARNGYDAPKEMLIRQVKNERKSIVADMTDSSSAEQLIDLLGENVVKKINKYYLDQLRAGRGKLAESFSGENAPSSSGQKIDYSEVNRRLRDLRNGTFKE